MPYRSLILFVCSGNICRSPMAEYILRDLVKKAGDGQRLQVASAGTLDLVGEPAATYAQQLLIEDGIDMSAHRSRGLDQQTIDEAELILVMTRMDRHDILMRFMRAQTKVYLLSEMVGKRFEIRDPYNGSAQEYAYCKGEIEDILTRGYDRVRDLALGLIDLKRRRR